MMEQISSVDQERKVRLPDSLKSIAEKLQKEKKLKPAFVRKVVLEAGVQPEDLEPWSDFDHPVQDSYGRKLIYQDENFEIMAMSWRPGDFSTIHDHGHTQWGCVQVFGPAEHATFRLDGGELTTLSRSVMEPYQAIGVNHTLVHQMGNPTHDKFFLTLHIYGDYEQVDNVTGDARLMDVETGTIQRVDGGVFFALPEKDIKRVEAGPKGDFPTRLRHMVELIRRLRRMEASGIKVRERLDAALKDFYSAEKNAELVAFLKEITTEKGHIANSVQWRILNWELKEAAKLQNELMNEQRGSDSFNKYAELYDAVIGKPSMKEFMMKYLHFFRDHYDIDFSDTHFISLGCGTGLVEKYLIDEMDLRYENLFGLDISEAMVGEANKRIDADVGDVLTLDPSVRLWDVAYSGLNVFHYIDFTRLEEAIQKTASIVRPGGYFFGDFITPDHIRWYPNALFSDDEKVISLRTPELIEQQGRMFQRSDIVNITFAEGRFRVSYAGQHTRFLPPVHRVRMYFQKAFGGPVDLYDAGTMELIPEWADSCGATRYVVVARKV